MIGLELEGYKKSTVEKYEVGLSFGNYVSMIIDNKGDFSCTGDYGDYSYSWRSFGDDFKSFLKKLNSGYLYGKLCKREHFDCYEWKKLALRSIINELRDGELEYEEARIVYDFIKDIEEIDSFDYVSIKLWESRELGEIYDEIHYSNIFPEQTYSPRQVQFIEEVYPILMTLL